MRWNDTDRGGWIGRLLTGTHHGLPAGGVALVMLGCLTVYGALAGCFDPGPQIAVAAVKMPLIVATAVLLCLPSFVVFAIVAGDPAPPTDLVRRLVAAIAVAALIMVALGPVVWLFSVTARSLAFVVLLHVLIATVALGFGVRPMRAASGSRGARRVALLWTLVFLVVSLQLTAFLGPVLGPTEDGRLFELRRESFLGRYHRVVTEPSQPR